MNHLFSSRLFYITDILQQNQRPKLQNFSLFGKFL